MILELKPVLSRLWYWQSEEPIGYISSSILLDLISTRLDLIPTRLDLIPTRLDLIPTRLDLISTRLDLIPLSYLAHLFSNLVEDLEAVGSAEPTRGRVLLKKAHLCIIITAFLSTEC
jgi:hypothetical protein